VIVPHVESPFENPFIDVRFNKFNINSSVISSYFTYGITDKWDVNVLIPVVVTDMNIQSVATIHNSSSNYSFENGQTQDVKIFSANGHKVGVGDVQLRTKYQFFSSEGLNMSGLLKVSFPTGNVANSRVPVITSFNPIWLLPKYSAILISMQTAAWISMSPTVIVPEPAMG
jgi:hypothetical protein